MDLQKGPLRIGGHMHPLNLFADAQPGFVRMEDRELSYLLSDLNFGRFHRACSLTKLSEQRRFAGTATAQILVALSDSLQRQQLVHAQIRRPGREAGSVLGPGVDAFGKRCSGFDTAAWTDFMLRPVFRHDDAGSRQVKHLPCFMSQSRNALKGSLATGTNFERVDDDFIRAFRKAKRMTVVTFRRAFFYHLRPGNFSVCESRRWKAACCCFDCFVRAVVQARVRAFLAFDSVQEGSDFAPKEG
ncbi:hypothetical protein OMP40_08305 [Cohnella rhizosphaerae]|uniref:Uncharacterized protein n=1 Tax=Cohnella rhizosphaerae TaxID=1457232 RepID=A0A9X4QTA7_9BACL|nr:hypothetical protein [Cohnella rhizosphaerae]MDG0809382.1 hypothetical protein [Cohnella rhizosphaerae]